MISNELMIYGSLAFTIDGNPNFRPTPDADETEDG